MTTETNEKLINSNYDDFCRYLIPFGSLDVWETVKRAMSLNMSMKELVEVIEEYCSSTDTDLFNSEQTVDIMAILNDYIIQMARNNIEEITGNDFMNDLRINPYFFGNYIDCPICYREEEKEKLSQLLKEHNITKDDVNIFTQFLLDEMEIELGE